MMHTFLTDKHLQISILNVSYNKYYHSSSKKFLWMSSKYFVCISSLCFEVMFCLTGRRNLMWREGCLPILSFNIGNFLEENNGIPYYYALKKEFGFPVFYWKLTSLA